MSTSVPEWLNALHPAQEPRLQRLSGPSSPLAWHVQVELEPCRVPPGASLTGTQTWNGKALVVSVNRRLERSVGEVEVVERLRSAFPARSSYWTAGGGNPPRQWREWALTPTLRQRATWLLDLDRRLRDADRTLRGNRRGWPDVVSWESGPWDLLCMEYKGPRPSSPDVLDVVSPEQVAWFEAALRHGVLDVDRYAIVVWVPAAAAKAILREQASARVRRRPNVESSRVGHIAGVVGTPRATAHQADEGLHRRRIRKFLLETTGADVESHVDGTIDVRVPPSSDVRTFVELVTDQVRRFGYTPAIEVVSSRRGGTCVRVSTPETLAQEGRGAHPRP